MRRSSFDGMRIRAAGERARRSTSVRRLFPLTPFARSETTFKTALFDLPLDFPIPEKLDELQPIGLLLLQFNPRSSSTIVEAASSLFFAELDEAQRAFEDVTLSLQGYKMTRELGAQEKRGRFCFEWRGEQLQVLREEGEKVEVTIQAEDVESMGTSMPLPAQYLRRAELLPPQSS